MNGDAIHSGSSAPISGVNHKINGVNTHTNGFEDDVAPLNILIVGAGIGGLTAGLALRQQGHNVTLFESSKFSQETGAAIHITPNCNGLLRRLGLHIEDVGANELTGLNLYAPDGNRYSNIDFSKADQIWQHSWLLVHRAHLHSMIRERAISNEGKGKPCELRLASKIIDVDPSKARITLESGETIQGDVVLGADGVHSQCRQFLENGNKFQPYDCGYSAFRFLVPTDQLKADPVTAEIMGNPGNLTMNIASDRRIVYYPCVDNTLMNCLLIHPSNESKIEGTGWNRKGDKSQMLAIANLFTDNFKALLHKAPEDTLNIWTLLDMDVLPTWVNDKLALLGDAAHPFLPHQAQGGAQAIEDAVSLSAVLPLGTLKKDITERLKLYETCRRDRANRIQEYTRQAGMSQEEMKKHGVTYDPLTFNTYNFDHDEWDYSSHCLKKYLWSKSPYRWRQTLSFGPSPGPRQPLNIEPDILCYARQHQIRHTIRFKTSKTYLQNLFPTPSYSFFTPGTYAQASITCCSLQNMVWLGDTGYNHCGLYIHGVKYTKRDGEELHGTFMPMLFESLADPIITGRDEIGAPKWFCDIDITPTLSSSGLSATKITMGWRGAVFGELEFDDLISQDAISEEGKSRVIPKPSPDMGKFMYKYTPAVAQPGVADIEYAMFDPHKVPPEAKDVGEANRAQQAKTNFIEEQRKRFGFEGKSNLKVARKASIKFEAKGWKALPTINHIAEGFAEMPIYEILDAQIEFIPEVGDVRQAHRIRE